MLKKLIAYDFRSTWRMALILIASSTLGGLISMGVRLVTYHLNYDNIPDILATFLGIGLGLGEYFSTLLVYLPVTFGFFLMCGIHYYKKIVSDEAYLTFTLPATPHQHLLSKMISGGLWSTIGAVVMVINFVIATLPTAIYNHDFYGDVTTEPDPVSALEAITLLGGIALLALVLLIAELGLVYLCLTIGGVVANKQKALVGIGLYWLTNGIASFVMVIVAFIISMILLIPSNMNGMWPIIVMLYIWSVVVVIFGVVFFFINRHLLATKLNLP